MCIGKELEMPHFLNVGELNETQRRRTDQRRERRKEHENELKFIQERLLKSNTTNEQQAREIRELKVSIA